MKIRAICAAAILAIAANASGADAPWPQFRGPGSRGIAADNPALPETWSKTENVAWAADVPGSGWASPVIANGKIFIATCISTDPAEAPRGGLYFGGERGAPKGVMKWVTLCFDLETGKELWRKSAKETETTLTHHLKNSFASETPCTDGERVYVYFGNIGIFAYDMEGKEVWNFPIPETANRYGWGTAASPIEYKGAIYVVNDNDTNSYLLALDAKTGKELWRKQREGEKTNWATPYIWETPGRTELVTPGTVMTRTYDLEGNLLWWFTGMSSISIPTPFTEHGLLYISSGYVNDQIRPAYAIKPGATGDITCSPDKPTNEHVAWYIKDAGPYNPTPVVYGDYYYTLFDRGFFTCHNAKTGELVYDKQRFSTAVNNFTSSPFAYNGKIFCMSEEGTTFVIKAGPKFEILGENKLDEFSMASPAIVGDSLFVRTASKLYRIKKSS